MSCHLLNLEFSYCNCIASADAHIHITLTIGIGAASCEWCGRKTWKGRVLTRSRGPENRNIFCSDIFGITFLKLNQFCLKMAHFVAQKIAKIIFKKYWNRSFLWKVISFAVPIPMHALIPMQLQLVGCLCSVMCWSVGSPIFHFFSYQPQLPS
jgi:hypothetical protein